MSINGLAQSTVGLVCLKLCLLCRIVFVVLKEKKREKSSAVISIFAKTATLTRRVKMTGHISEG